MRKFILTIMGGLICSTLGLIIGLAYGMHHAFDITDVGDVFFQEKLANPCIVDTHNLDPACAATTKYYVNWLYVNESDAIIMVEGRNSKPGETETPEIVYFNWPKIEQCASDYLNGNASPWLADDDKNLCNLLLAAHHAGWLAANTGKPDPYPPMPLMRSDDAQKRIFAKQQRLQQENPRNIGNYHNKKEGS